MAQTFHLSVVAPDKSVVEDTVTSLIAPGAEGYFGVMAGHAPLIASLRPGVMEYVDSGSTRHFVFMSGGFAEVNGSSVTILADEAQPAEEIDVKRAEMLLEDSRRVLRGEMSDQTTEEALDEVEKAVHRLRAARIAAGR